MCDDKRAHMVICAQPGTGEAPNKRRAEAAAAAPAGAKRQKKNCRAARAASLNTVLAAVQERAVRQGSGAMDASVGCAPTTVEDCLKASSFGVIRKVISVPSVVQHLWTCSKEGLFLRMGGVKRLAIVLRFLAPLVLRPLC